MFILRCCCDDFSLNETFVCVAKVNLQNMINQPRINLPQNDTYVSVKERFEQGKIIITLTASFSYFPFSNYSN